MKLQNLRSMTKLRIGLLLFLCLPISPTKSTAEVTIHKLENKCLSFTGKDEIHLFLRCYLESPSVTLSTSQEVEQKISEALVSSKQELSSELEILDQKLHKYISEAISNINDDLTKDLAIKEISEKLHEDLQSLIKAELRDMKTDILSQIRRETQENR